MNTIGSSAYYATNVRHSAAEKNSGSTAGELQPSVDVRPDEGAASTRSNTLQPENAVDNRPSSAATNFQGRLFGMEHTLKVGLEPKMVHETLKGTWIWELPEAEYQEYLSHLEQMVATLELQYTERPQPETVEESLKLFPVSPATQPYATVTVGGKLVATIDNQGVVSTENDQLGMRLSKLLLGDVGGRNGPVLAQARAHQIATLLGGQVTKSVTAMTQLEFNALPSIEQPKWTVNWEALMQDSLYTQLQSLKEKREEYLNRQ